MTFKWEEHKSTMIRLYLNENRTLKEVKRIMKEEHDFDASTRSYRQRFDKWDVGKYNCRRRQARRASAAARLPKLSEAFAVSDSTRESVESIADMNFPVSQPLVGYHQFGHHSISIPLSNRRRSSFVSDDKPIETVPPIFLPSPTFPYDMELASLTLPPTTRHFFSTVGPAQSSVNLHQNYPTAQTLHEAACQKGEHLTADLLQSSYHNGASDHETYAVMHNTASFRTPESTDISVRQKRTILSRDHAYGPPCLSARSQGGCKNCSGHASNLSKQDLGRNAPLYQLLQLA